MFCMIKERKEGDMFCKWVGEVRDSLFCLYSIFFFVSIIIIIFLMKKKEFFLLIFLIINNAESIGVLHNFLVGEFSVGRWLSWISGYKLPASTLGGWVKHLALFFLTQCTFFCFVFLLVFQNRCFYIALL